MDKMKEGYYTLDVKTPIQGMTVMTNVYWLCKDGDPTQAIFYNGTAQCNHNEEITKKLCDYTKERTGWDVQVVYFETAYRPTPRHTIFF